MDQKLQTCAACGGAMSFRLGQFECPACGQIAAAAPVAAAPETRRAPPTGGSTGQWDPGAQYRQPPAQAGLPSAPTAGGFAPPTRRQPAQGTTWTRRKLLAARLLIIGGLGFVLPLTHVQFVVLSLFGRFEYYAASAFVVIGCVLLALPE
jgi:hypothetical protein